MNYVTDDTMNAYLRSVQPMYDGVLGEIQKEAIAAEVPIVPPEVARLLSVLLTMQKPKNILEIGTAVAFSAGLMCRYLPEEGTVTTIDRYEVMLKDSGGGCGGYSADTGRPLRCDFHGCGEGAVSGVPAALPAASACGRSSDCG